MPSRDTTSTAVHVPRLGTRWRATSVGLALIGLGSLASCDSGEPAGSAGVAPPGMTGAAADEPPGPPLDDATMRRAVFDLEEGTIGEAIKAMNALAASTPSDAQREELRDHLRLALQHRSGTIRHKAVKLLDQWYGRDAVPDLIDALRGEAGLSTSAAIKALSHLAPDDEDVQRAVAARLAEPSDRSRAKDFLEAIGPAAEPHVLPLLGHEDKRVRQAALSVLAKIGTSNSIPAVEALLDEPGSVGKDAARTLEAIRARE